MMCADPANCYSGLLNWKKHRVAFPEAVEVFAGSMLRTTGKDPTWC